jgi:8-oxo-dGTP pyrophosphatase MutT (NUDIX family)
MVQIYKVFINNRPFFLAGNDVQERMTPGTLFLRHDGEATFDLLLHLAHTEPIFFSQVYLVSETPNKLFRLLLSRCKVIEAAGGLVRNEEGKLLMIFRNGRWDLPKGKIEKKEKPEVAAIREVEEECGIGKLKIVKDLPQTYHTYMQGERIVLKETHWYEMTCADNCPLVPQTEEGITDVRWLDEKEVESALENTFLSVIDVVRGRDVRM